jgi:hypothetical protein
MTKMKLFFLALALLATVSLSACTSRTEDRLTAADLDLAKKTEPTGPILFSFIVMGDNGSINPVFEEIIGRAAAGDAAFLIHTGDITDGKSKKELTDAQSYLDKNLGKPYYIVIGDNDYMVNTTGKRTDADFISVFGETARSFDYQNSHFVIIDSSDEKNSFSDEELDWLETDLAKTNKDFIFLAMHVPVEIPMAASLFGEPSAQMQKQNSRFREIIAKHNVSQIYTGHFHGYLNYEIAKIPVAVTGGAGSAPQFGFDADYHYLEVSVYEDGFRNKYQPVNSSL